MSHLNFLCLFLYFVKIHTMLTKLFGFNPKESTVRTEITAGITTFLTMAYILAVNPAILSQTGMDEGALFTTTVLMAAIPTILMGLYAKLPLALAPGMGLNAFFAITVCGAMGCSWQFALTAVFLEGLMFILLTLTNLREKIVEVLPNTLKSAISAGIGLYIAFIGLQNAGIIVNHDATLVAMGDISAETTYEFATSALLGLIGIAITAILLVRKIRGALLIGIILTTLIGIPMGVTNISEVLSTPPSIEPIFMKFEWSDIFSFKMFMVVFTLLFVDLFDCIGTVIGVATRAGLMKDGKIPRLKEVFMVDSLSTTAGAVMGTSTVAVYVESAAGVNEGGRSGLTSVVTGICFLCALFFAPLFLAIPAAAIAPVLVLVGLMMMSSVISVDFNNYSEAIPAFICILFMPLSYSISEGIVLGHLAYILINVFSKNYKKVTMGMYILGAFFLLKFILPYSSQDQMPSGYCSIDQTYSHFTQAVKSFTVSVDGTEQISVEKTSSTFTNLTSSKDIEAKRGDEIVITFENGVWTNGVWIGFDWNRDGIWEDVREAYPVAREEESSNQGVFTITVPDTAAIGKSMVRLVSDGVVDKASWNTKSPMIGTHGEKTIGCCGSVHDMALRVSE